jgi:very-short-patch-repair endonuclease
MAVGGHYDSPPARRLCRKLAQAGLGPFELDYQLVTPEGVVLIDVAWPRARVGLEYNGRRDHDGALAQVKDARRRNRLTAIGWLILDANRGMTDEEIIRWVRSTLAATA